MKLEDTPALKSELLQRLRDRTAVVGIFGLGYVGLPLALRFAEVGYRVLGFDIDGTKVEALNAGRSYIEHIAPATIAAARKRKFEATGSFARAAECDALIICVPTPLDKHRQPDLSFVLGTVDSMVPYLRAGQVMSLESTTWPGTTEEELKPRIEARGLQIGVDFHLCFSPEREDPGNASFATRTIPKICGGSTAACLQAGLALYGQVIDQVVPVSSTRVAEMTKLLENIHRAVNIGLVNEMKIICDRMGIDVHEVIRAAATKPFGFVPYWPGPGLGGHCIPIDPFYLTWKAREYGLHTRFIELAGEINRTMPEWVIGKTIEALNQRGKALHGSRVLVLGIAYKKNVDDMRESPAVELMELLVARGAKVEYSDPHVPVFPKMREHRFDLKSVPLSAAALEAYDLVLLATDHGAVDYDLVRKHARLIVDTRGVYLDPAPNVVKA
ncbi:MAG TPA: nucleotide sugar dehydrogenase [Burkholderiales bacterium]|nr:nucleotide sugar dehydrogenase [Burkholderiales bacterium]